MEKFRKFNLFMEGFWLVAALASLVVVAILMYQRGVNQNFELLIFPFLAGLMFAFRRIFRKRYEKQQNQNQGNPN